MKLLAIDTTTDRASVALLYGEELLQKEQVGQRTQAQFILPLIDRLMIDASMEINQLDAIVFGRGPGSFTGLRIACSIAKGLAYAHDLGLIPVSSLASIAWSARQQYADANILAVLDARMHEMYWAYYSKVECMAEERVNAVAEISVPTENPLIIAGVGIDEYWDGFSAEIKAQTTHKLTIYPSAASMIHLARSTAIQPIPVSEAQPVYVRNRVTYDR